MKMYKEMLRKTAVVGIPLLAITLVFTLVSGGQACFGSAVLTQSTSAVAVLPILRYYVFTAILFAFYGFSFLFTRKASDVYHSLPVKRGDLYLSVTLATATWMGGTIVLNALEMLFMLLVSGCPFVPAYILLSIPFYFIASMLVFSTAAIGCSLSGSIVTAIASTGIILCLPRFVQFMFARGIVERVPIIGWLDIGTLLDPSTNIATGLIVMQLRQVFFTRIITLGHILYSLLPLLVMLGIGYWAFNRRPSEIAHRNSSNKIWTTVTAVLLSYAVMLPITMQNQTLLSVYGAVLVLASVAVYFVYQLIVAQNIKTVLKSTPFFLLALCLMLGTSLLIETTADNMLNTVPTGDEIQSVTFRGTDESKGDAAYTTGLINTVAFTDDSTKQYVSLSLQKAVEEVRNHEDSYYYDYEYNPYEVIEPVTIKLTNGKTIRRTIEFANIDELNALRLQNEAFAASVKSFPPLDSVQYIYVDNMFTQEENEAILASYVTESQEKGLINGYYYKERALDTRTDGSTIYRGENQTIMTISSAGYTGATRYYDNYRLRLEAPDTVSLLMKTYNAYNGENPTARITEIMKRFTSGLAADNDDLNVVISVYNFPDEDGVESLESTNMYISQYTLKSQYAYDMQQLEYFHKFMDILVKATMTDDPQGLFVRLNWYYYDSASMKQNAYYDTRVQPTAFLRFDTQEDEQAFVDLVNEWNDAMRSV